MLTPEKAREELNRLRDSNRAAEALAAIDALPNPLKAAGLFILGRGGDADAHPLHALQRIANRQSHAAAILDAASQSDRRALWSALFPRLSATLLEGAWQAQKATPYQVGYARKAFRAPGDPTVSQHGRYLWVWHLWRTFGAYNPDLAWVATWAAHADIYGAGAGPLLVAAIDAGGPEGEAVLQTLIDSASGTHEIGGMGRHVVRGLLGASRPEGWEFIEKLLLAAQRQEGLRQSVLEAIDEANPVAFRRMLRLILDHDLARFSATVRALDTWFGFAWDSVSVKAVNTTIVRALQLLDDPEARARNLAAGEAEDTYLALWSIAFEDAHAAIPAAGRLLDDPDVGRRFVAVHLLSQLGLPAARTQLLRAYDDADLRVALRANVQSIDDFATAGRSDLFERAERLLARLPAKSTPLEPIVWPWQIVVADRRMVATTLLNSLGERPASRLVGHLPVMEPYQRAAVVLKVIEAAPDAPETRALLLGLAADASSSVRDEALKGLANGRISPDEARRLEPLLTRKADDLRQGVLTLLWNQPDDEALASADRLLAAGKPEPRRGGLELLRRLADAGRRPADCRDRASAYRDARPSLNGDEARQVDAVLDTGRTVATLDNALGLIDPADRTPPAPPVARKRPWLTPAALACLRSLSALVHEHREEPITFPGFGDQIRKELLGNIQYGFPGPDGTLTAADDSARLPLRGAWESWWAPRPRALRDKDGLELIRAWAMPAFGAGNDETFGKADTWPLEGDLRAEVLKTYGPSGLAALPYSQVVVAVLGWLIRLHPVAGAADFLIDAVETSFTRVPPETLTWSPPPGDWTRPDWRKHYRSPYTTWLGEARSHRALDPPGWTAAHHVRLFGLLRWMDEPGTGVARHTANLDETLAAFEAGGATPADLYDLVFGPGADHHRGIWLFHLSGRKPAPAFQRSAVLREVVARGVARVVEVELDRGEAPTAASGLALSVRSLRGTSILLRLLQALGSLGFQRAFNWQGDQGKAAVLSHLIRVTFPGDDDTPEAFATETARRNLSETRLIELAVFAPQWARFVEWAIGWPQLEEAVWWLHAHTKGSDWSVDNEIREVWTAEVAARTALTAPDLLDGAVDVAWFQRAYLALGPKRWPALDEAAKYASGGTGHARARLFAAAMLGTLKKAEVVARVKQKRNADSLRALGLLPLARGAARERDLPDRYQTVQEFLRTSKPFGAMRQASEKRAASIALDNLARTAGYTDPIRLEWAMEAKAVADLAAGPVTVEADGVSVALAIDDQGQPDLTATRAGKPLKAIPPTVKANKSVAALIARKTDLKRQASRVRVSLESAMCRGDTFTGDELKQLAGHAILAPLLVRLVLLGEGIAGYPVEGGRALRDHAGRLEPVKPGESIRVAHPHDLLGLGDWHHWQRDCFAAERAQPIKQVFRELYVLTDAERTVPLRSLRYAGHQVNPAQALALLGGRGWVNHPEEGVRRTFHEAGLTAEIDVLNGTFTPAEVEGVTLDSVRFVRRGEWKPTPLADVPPRIFSEVMRDLDLVVSVAHRGGVDPEASASTVEMRAGLLRETCTLLRLANVRVKEPHALIDGALGQYSVHLGSGVVHRQPGGALCIVPVHAEHRGRLFLPFADDDPRTAEVLSKALMLARDSEIQDPTILAQIRAGV